MFKTNIIQKSEPHKVRYTFKQIQNSSNGHVYKVAYPEKFARDYDGTRLVSLCGGVLYVGLGNISIVDENGAGWVQNKVEFERVDADIDITITEK